jgi:hypothetical protein
MKVDGGYHVIRGHFAALALLLYPSGIREQRL